MRLLLTGAKTALVIICIAAVSSAQSMPSSEERQHFERLAATLAQEAATLCPLADPADQQALDHCRTALFKDSYFKRSLARIVLWGRPRPVAMKPQQSTKLEQYGEE